MLADFRDQLHLERAKQLGVRVQTRLAIEEHRAAGLRQPLQRLLRRFRRERAARGQPLRRGAGITGFEQQLVGLRQRVVAGQRLQRRDVGLAPSPLFRRHREDAAAAERGCMRSRGLRGGCAAQQKTQSGDGGRRMRQPQLAERALSGGELRMVDQRDDTPAILIRTLLQPRIAALVGASR